MQSETKYHQIGLELGNFDELRRVTIVRWFRELMNKLGWNTHIEKYIMSLEQGDLIFSHWKVGDTTWRYQEIFDWFFQDGFGLQIVVSMEYLIPLIHGETMGSGSCGLRLGSKIEPFRVYTEGTYSKMVGVEELLVSGEVRKRSLGITIQEFELEDIKIGYRKELGIE